MLNFPSLTINYFSAVYVKVHTIKRTGFIQMQLMKALFDRNLHFNIHLINKTEIQPFTLKSDYVRPCAAPLRLLKFRAHLGTSGLT